MKTVEVAKIVEQRIIERIAQAEKERGNEYVIETK